MTTTFSAANFDWKQGLGDETDLEIRIPFNLPKGIEVRDLTVKIGDSDILIIKVRSTTLWQGRFYAQVLPDSIDWHVSDRQTLIVEVNKKLADQWPALLNVPLRPSDPYLLPKKQLDFFLQLEMPPLASPENGEDDDIIPEETLDVKDDPLCILKTPSPQAALKLADEDKGDSSFVDALTILFNSLNACDISNVAPQPYLRDLTEEISIRYKWVSEQLSKTNEELNEEGMDEKSEGKAPVEAVKEKVKKTFGEGEEEMEKNEKNKINGFFEHYEENNAERKENEKEVKKKNNEVTQAKEEKISDEDKTAEEKKKIADKFSVKPNDEAKVDGEDLDLDAILENAVEETLEKKDDDDKSWEELKEKKIESNFSENKEEIVEKKPKENNEEDSIDVADENSMQLMAIKMELRGNAAETKAIQEKHDEMVEKLKTSIEGSEEYQGLLQSIAITERMLSLGKASRLLRSQPSTITNLLKIQRMDIAKARANINSVHSEEEEEYEDGREKQLTGLELFNGAIRSIEADPARAVHLWRLAAIYKHHGPSAVALFSVYANIPSSYVRGVHILVTDALRDKDMESRTNSKVADLFNQGIKHFPPLFALAVFFYQRAAQLGHTHALVNLYSLYTVGHTISSPIPNDKTALLLKNDNIARYFLRCGLERGSVSCYLILAALYAEGKQGFPKDLVLAKKYYNRAFLADESLRRSPAMRIAGGMTIGELGSVVNAFEKPSTGVVDLVIEDSDDKIPEARVSLAASSTAVVPSAQSKNAIKSVGELQIADRRMPITVAATTAKKASGIHPRGIKAQKFWERAAKIGVSVYGVYCVAFPIRVLLIPYFYSFVSRCMELVGLAPAGSSNIYMM